MFVALESSGLGTWIRESPSIFAYTFFLICHVIGLGTVIGFNGLISARILGFAPKIPLNVLRSLWVPIWVGFGINLTSGIGLFVADAVKFQHMTLFWVKMFFVLSGMVISYRLKTRYLDDNAAMAGTDAPASARPLAWVILGVWALALISGRLTGYPDMFDWFTWGDYRA